MKRYDYIVAYDIKNQKRLQKVAKFLEKEIIRIQYSVYIAKNFSPQMIYLLADRLIELINPEEDDIRIYRIKDYGYRLGKAFDLKDIFVIK